MRPPPGAATAGMISVVVPTRNRAGRLARALDALAAQTAAPDAFEVIVADNGSTDDTASVCRRFEGGIPGLRVLPVRSPGLHEGRHAGYFASRGEILAFIDDDVRPDPAWIEGIAESLADPRVGIAGGRILPEFEGDPPAWVETLKSRMPWGWALGYLSILDFGDTALEIPPEYVWGCNFSIRKDLLRQVGGFHPDSLPDGMDRYRGDGETAVARAVAALGYRAFYNPRAGVHHLVPRERMTVAYLARRAFLQGISDSFTKIRAEGGIRPGTRRAMFVKRLRGEASCFLCRIRSGRGSIDYALRRGYLDGFFFHREQAMADPALMAWVLRPDYLEGRDPAVPGAA